MKIRFNTVISIILALILLLPYALVGSVFSYYSSVQEVRGTVGISRLDVGIEDLEVYASNQAMLDEGVIWSAADETLNDGTIRVNSANVFSFSVVNFGVSDISYSLKLELAWDNDLKEAGKILVYPASFADDAIFNNLDSGIFDGAIIGYAFDEAEVVLSDGMMRLGISEVIDSGSLNGGTGHLKSEYSYKVFFYEDLEVFNSPSLFHGQEVELNIVVEAKLKDSDAVWTAGANEFFKLTAVMDNIFPVIDEIHNPKTFFVSQGEDINLTLYAKASDRIDGDLTANIVISSVPEFNPNKAGTYTIIYNVKNSIGNEAVPLKIKLVIWDFVKIESGYYHTLALTSHGKVYTWGYNISGQLGLGDYSERSTPTLIESLDNIVDVAAGQGTGYALTADGQLYSWGRNENGRLGDNTTVAKNSPVRVHQPEGVRFVSVSANFSNAGAVTENGEVYTWGYGGYGALGTGVAGDRHVPVKIGVSDVVQLSMGLYNGAAVTSAGELYTWGDNAQGQLGNGANMAVGTNAPKKVPLFSDGGIKVDSVSAGHYHMAAVSRDGLLYTWGDGAEGRLGNGGTLDRNTPQLIDMGQPVVKALAGYFHTGILLSDGTVFFSGQNAYGKHGTGNATNNLVPKQAIGVFGAMDISLGYDSSFVLVGGTAVYGMGYGGTGVLGTGNNANSNLAVKWAFVAPSAS